MQTYSWKKGVLKGLISLLSIAGAFLAFTAFSDITLWDLIVTYVKPLLGSLTVGGVIVIAINYLKVKLSSSNS